VHAFDDNGLLQQAGPRSVPRQQKTGMMPFLGARLEGAGHRPPDNALPAASAFMTSSFSLFNEETRGTMARVCNLREKQSSFPIIVTAGIL
jgi:hypothetical protein